MLIPTLLVLICVFFGLLWAIAFFYLRGPNLAIYDDAPNSQFEIPSREPSTEHHQAVDFIKGIHARRVSGSFKERIATMRSQADEFGKDASMEGITIIPVQIGEMAAEWVLPEGYDPSRRLLYIHGGAFFAGSPKSHRVISTRLARENRMSVLAIDYRMQPEHSRLDCLTDCQLAYQWIVDNGPDGQAPVTSLFVAGDSAGGNLTLAVIAWARDTGLRPAEGAIALSPVTDATARSPSVKDNIATDYMIGPSLGKLLALPNLAFLWLFVLINRLRPCDPRMSPIVGDLSNLPPTLVHASSAEMLLDDSRRYVSKALKSGSETTLRIWPHMIHVWHLFPYLPEADEAFEHISEFISAKA